MKPTVVIRPARGLFDLDLTSVWRSWELLYFLVWRDVKVRYKQTLLGVAWVVVQPLVTMVLFTAVFSRLAGLSSDGVPYPLFVLTALLPWTYFSQAISRGGTSVVANAGLVTKVYFPRLAIPISSVVSPLVDLVACLGIVAVVLAWYRVVPGWSLMALPALIVLCAATALAVTLWVSALCVKYRDVGVMVPFLLQIWLWVSPVAYSSTAVPDEWRFLYGLNPLVGVIEGFRWALAGTATPDVPAMTASVLVVLLLLAGGTVYFKRTEQTFADLV
jgi:lipopolysaccharide transport system permease protein